MTTTKEIFNEYSALLRYIDLELIIAHTIKKTREFVLIHPEYQPTKSEQQKIISLIKRRISHEPLAYILGHKEFYGLDFIVNKHTLIPRPETELMVEQVLELLRNKLLNNVIVDVGTGSGCIITSIANEAKNDTTKFYAIDISKEALRVAKQNAKKNGVDKKIKFIKGNLLSPFKNSVFKDKNLIIAANLPYLSKDIYESSKDNVKKFEPKSALYSPEEGLQHYRKLLEQIKNLPAKNKPEAITCFLEISPEQKKLIQKLINSIFSGAKLAFTKDLAGKWRICKIEITNN